MITLVLTPKEVHVLQIALQWETDPILRSITEKLKTARRSRPPSTDDEKWKEMKRTQGRWGL